ncbi:MAG: hypothetical protein H7323_08555 [Frankiales bacterium]|nr:hypothetical protein [Frankiales bacterium]
MRLDLDQRRRIGVNQLAFDRDVQCCAQRPLQPADQGGRHGVAAAVKAPANSGKRLLNVPDAQVVQSQMPQLGAQIALSSDPIEND